MNADHILDALELIDDKYIVEGKLSYRYSLYEEYR